MGTSLSCAWCAAVLLDVDHAKAHVAEKCTVAPWRKQIDDLKAAVTNADGRADQLAQRLAKLDAELVETRERARRAEEDVAEEELCTLAAETALRELRAAAVEYLRAHKHFSEIGAAPERPEAAKALADAWLEFNKAVGDGGGLAA